MDGGAARGAQITPDMLFSGPGGRCLRVETIREPVPIFLNSCRSMQGRVKRFQGDVPAVPLVLPGAAIHHPPQSFPACAVVRVTEGQALRLAAVVGGVYFDNLEALLVGIPEICF